MATSSFSELRDGLDSALQKLKPLITRLQTSAGNKDAAREANSEATRLLRGALVATAVLVPRFLKSYRMDRIRHCVLCLSLRVYDESDFYATQMRREHSSQWRTKRAAPLRLSGVRCRTRYLNASQSSAVCV